MEQAMPALAKQMIQLGNHPVTIVTANDFRDLMCYSIVTGQFEAALAAADETRRLKKAKGLSRSMGCAACSSER
jgi:hypothetical protein